MVAAKSGAFGQLGIALAFGLVITTMIYALGHISGAHFNPAVSFAFALSRHFPWSRVGAYWLGQCLGAIAAALLLRASLGDIADVGATQPSGSDAQSFLWEVVLTFFLMLVIMAVATDTRAVGEAAAIAVGGTVASLRARRRARQRCLDEPRPLARACASSRRAGFALDLPARAAPRSRARRPRLPAPSRGARKERSGRARRLGTRSAASCARCGLDDRKALRGRVGRHARLDDRAVDAVRHLVREGDAHVLEAGGLEAGLVLADGERAGDAAGEIAALEALLGAEAILGDDVRDPDPAARPQDA